MEDPARMARQPIADGGMFVGCAIVENDMDDLADRNSTLDGVEETDEFLMAMALQVLPDHCAVEHPHRSEQGRGPVALVVVGHGSRAAFLEGQARLGSVERLDLGFLIDAKHDGVRRQIDTEPDNVTQLAEELRVLGQFELPHAMRLEPVSTPDALNRGDADADGLGQPRWSNGLSRPAAAPGSVRRRARPPWAQVSGCGRVASCRVRARLRPRRKSAPASARRRSWICQSRARWRSCRRVQRSTIRSALAIHVSVLRCGL
jgi:hypothetical protein